MSAPDPLRELEDALSFPVSADFSARVRQQVAAEPVRSRAGAVRWLGLAAAVTVAVGAGVLTSIHHPSTPMTQAGATPASGPGTLQLPSAQVAAPSIDPVRVASRTTKASVGEQVRVFDTLVPDDQLRALDRLLAAMRDGRTTVPAQVSNDEVNDRGERVLRALVIEPVTIELLAGSPADANKNPGKDRNR